MNCYEFTALDGLALNFAMIEDSGYSGTQTNTSRRPTTRTCLRCKTRYTNQDPPTNAPPRKHNACSKEEYAALAIRNGVTCFRFTTGKMPWADSQTITGPDGSVCELSWRPNRFNPYRYPPRLKPWDEQDPYYPGALRQYNAFKNNIPYFLQFSMWLQNTVYYNEQGPEVIFNNCEDGTIGYFSNDYPDNPGAPAVTLGVSFL